MKLILVSAVGHDGIAYVGGAVSQAVEAAQIENAYADSACGGATTLELSGENGKPFLDSLGNPVTKLHVSQSVSAVQALCDAVNSPAIVETGLAAAGTNSGTATVLSQTATQHNVTTGTGGVIFGAPVAVGVQHEVTNSTNSAITLYPYSGNTLNGGSSVIIAPGRTAIIAGDTSTNALAENFGGESSTQAVSTSTAVDVVNPNTTIDSSGGVLALTLADGYQGQPKTIVHSVAGNNAVLTPSHLAGKTTITFSGVGQSVLLKFLGTKWYIISNQGAALA